MPTNSEIREQFQRQAYAFAHANGLPIFYSGSKNNTDGVKEWVECQLFTNDYDPFLSDPRAIRRGIFQVSVCNRKGATASKDLQSYSDLIEAEWPKGRVVTGSVQVTRTPYILTDDIIEFETYNSLVMSIEYHE